MEGTYIMIISLGKNSIKMVVALKADHGAKSLWYICLDGNGDGAYITH